MAVEVQAQASAPSGRLSSPSSAPGVRRTRRFAIGGLVSAALVALALALVFTLGREKQQAAGGVQGSGSGISAAKDSGAAVTPLVGAHDGHAAATSAAAAAGATTTTDQAAAAATTASTGASATTQQGGAAPTASGLGLLQEALAKNPLLSAAGDPLQVLGKQQQHQHQHQMDMGDMDMGDMDMDDMDMGEGSISEVKAYLGESTCLVADIDELQDAVENGVCPLVVLTSAAKGAYMLMDMGEILVQRRVRVMGHPAVLPKIDAMMGMRAFRVGPGGFLDLQFVRVVQSMGMYRTRYGLEGREGMGTQVLEIRGGGVMLDPGAEGAEFLGVVFLMVATDEAMVNVAIEDTANLSGWRIYGGHVYVAAGTVRFLNCHFWDTMVIMPLTDVVAFGGDVLVVAGNVFFTGCTFTTTMLLSNYASAGWNVATLSGTTVVTFTTFQWQSIAMSMAVAGMVLFTGGGVTVLTGVDFRYVGVVMNFMGMGSFCTGAGALISTGVTQEQAFAVFASFGAGMYNALGAGVMAEQGATYVMFSGPGYMSMTGAMTFVGTGSSTHVGVPAVMYGSTGTQHGQGGFSYNGAGVSVWVGCPLAMFWATFSFFGLGGVTSHGAGIMVWVGNPVFMPMAVSYFAGLGSVMFVGGGSAVIVGSPVAMPMAVMAWSGPSMPMMTDDVMNPESTFGMMNHTTMEMDMGNMTMDHMMMMMMPAMFWIQGSTDADGSGAAYVTGSGTVSAMPHPKWASHLLESDPEYNLWDAGMANRTGGTRARQLQQPPPPQQQQQQQQLSASSLTDALALFGSDPVGNPKLLAMGLDVNPDVDVSVAAVYDQFKSWVPAPMLEAAKGVAELRNQLDQLQASRGLGVGMGLGQEEPATLRVENSLLDYCGVCETEGEVVGAGMEVCDVEASCQSLQARAPPAAQALFDYDELAFDPQAIVIADFRPTTAAGDTLDPQAFQRALRGYLKANGTTGFQVTAFAAAPSPDDYTFLPQDAASKERQRALFASSLANDEFPLTHPIRAVFVTPDPAKAAALAQALEDPESDSYADMELFVGDALTVDPEAGVTVQALDASLAQAITVPAYRSPGFTQAFADRLDSASATSSAGSGSSVGVRLVDAANAGVPLTRAVTGQAYTVKLGGFSPLDRITVQLLGQRDGRQTVALVKALLAADKEGAAAFTWTVPASQAPGDYYFKATDLTGAAFGFSPTFTVDTKRRRRLFGPAHEFFD